MCQRDKSTGYLDKLNYYRIRESGSAAQDNAQRISQLVSIATYHPSVPISSGSHYKLLEPLLLEIANNHSTAFLRVPGFTGVAQISIELHTRAQFLTGIPST